MSGRYNRRWPHGRDPFGVTAGVMAEHCGRFDVSQVARCVGCGCDDNHACFDEQKSAVCTWLRLDRAVRLGVCSACPGHIDRWDRGERSLAAPANDDNR